MQKTEFNIALLSWQTLERVPSASGIVKFKESYYVIGDDSPYLFHIDKNFKLISKTQIYSIEKLQGNTIPKIDKPDFEAMEMVSETEILIFGSGSKSLERDVCILVEIGKQTIYKKYNLSLFYDYLRGLETMQGFELDIEGLAFDGTSLYLFNRSRNLIFSFSYKKFIDYCKTGRNFPIPKSTLYALPEINGLEAGFSGATMLECKLIFTAAVENTPNAYDDGEILGSFIGVIPLENGTISDHLLIRQIPNPGFPLKVEGITINKAISNTQTDLILVTDNDGKSSEILKLRMTVNKIDS